MRIRCPPVHALLAALAAVACMDSDTVYPGPSAFVSPPSAAQGFLGYAGGTDAPRPICGNCHVGIAAEWEGTRHAGAWAALATSDSADANCEGCHTVGARGNAVVDTLVAWRATQDARYHDVQCESCHGPGLDHVTNTDASQPFASIAVGLALTNGCGECHRGTHQPFVEEWEQSRHAARELPAQTQAACVRCHEGRGVLRSWGIITDYVEENQADPVPITCPICHDPHDRQFEGQLRFPVDTADLSLNLCMHCHQEGGTPGAGRPRPHAPQGPLLLGQAGWWPPGFTFPIDTIVGTHGTVANPRTCATCHVSRMEVTDAATGAFVFEATGHLFQAIPCLDATGRPTVGTCADSTRTFAACTSSGCHSSQSQARGAFQNERAVILGLVATLNSQLAQLPQSEFDSTDNKLTTAEGARFNAELATPRGATVHNPFLVEALLNASIQRVTADYGIAPASRRP